MHIGLIKRRKLYLQQPINDTINLFNKRIPLLQNWKCPNFTLRLFEYIVQKWCCCILFDLLQLHTISKCELERRLR